MKVKTGIKGGFLGFGGGDRKKSYMNAANDARGIRTAMGSTYRPQYSSIRSGMQAYQTDRNNTAESYPTIRSGWTDLATNPMRPDQGYKAGYSPETVNQMRTAASDTVAGGRANAMRNINRQAAAQGMGNTGAAMRQVAALEPKWTSEAISARRGADLDAAEAERLDRQKNYDREAADYWAGIDAKQAALQGLDVFERGRESFNRNSWLDQLGALDAETGTYSTDLGALDAELEAYGGAYRPGGWSRFGGQLGGAFANRLFGGGSNG